VLDVIFGILRSIKEHKTNSTIGIDGIVRKVAMLFTIACCIVLDYIVEIDLIGFIPENAKEVMHIGRIGTSDLFAFLYCVFECLSIFKNMLKLGVPLPIRLKKFLEKLLKEFTSEIKDEK
jgi:toxin secretion/phage lysis holin